MKGRWRERRQCSDEDILRRALITKDGYFRIPIRPVPRRINKTKLRTMKVKLPVHHAARASDAVTVGNAFIVSHDSRVANPGSYGTVWVNLVDAPTP